MHLLGTLQASTYLVEEAVWGVVPGSVTGSALVLGQGLGLGPGGEFDQEPARGFARGFAREFAQEFDQDMELGRYQVSQATPGCDQECVELHRCCRVSERTVWHIPLKK